MSTSTRIPGLALTALAFALAAPQASASGGEWESVIAPYIWGAGITTDLKMDTPPVTGGSDNDYTDLIDELDGIFQIHGETQNEKWGVMADFAFIGLAAEEERQLFDSESDLDVRLSELALVWSPDDGKYSGFEAFGGLRRVEIDFTSDFTPHNPVLPDAHVDFNRDYNDFLLGARYTVPLADRWTLTLRGDGSFGDTDGTWGASAMFGYHMEHGSWVMGYRYLAGNFNNDNGDLDNALSGFQVGYAFSF
jgi:hypothetical protein